MGFFIVAGVLLFLAATILTALRSMLGRKWTSFPKRECEGARSADLWKYEIFSRRGKWRAERTGAHFRMADALTFVLFNVAGVPLFSYRYGWRRAILLVLLPILLSYFVLSLKGGANTRSLIDGVATLAMVFVVPAAFLAMTGLWVGARADQWRKAIAMGRGWVPVACCYATDRKAALGLFTGSPARKSSRERIGFRVFSNRRRSHRLG